MLQRIKDILYSLLYPPRPMPMIEKRKIICPECRALHNLTFIDGRPIGGHAICENCINKAIFGDLEEEALKEAAHMIEVGSKL